MPAELNPTILIAVVAAIGVLLIVFGAATRPPKDAVQQRLEQLVVKPRTLEEAELDQPFFERAVRPLVARLSRLSQRGGGLGMVERAEARLHQAGYPGGLRGADWMGVKVLGSILFAIIFTILFLALMGFPVGILFGIGGLAVGFLAPEFWLGRKIRARQMDMILQLPDALDLLTISVEAGLGFDAALAKVVEKMEGPLVNEFRQALAEIRMGRLRRDALRDVASRADAQPVTNFIGAIVQAEQLGVPIAKVLQIQSQQLRIERRQRAEEAAAKAPVKMLFPMVGCIFPTIFIVILGPAIVTVVRGVGI
jgi:tight adherence protein C